MTRALALVLLLLLLACQEPARTVQVCQEERYSSPLQGLGDTETVQQVCIDVEIPRKGR